MYIIIAQSEVASKTVSKYVFMFVSTERGITNSHVFTLDQSHL